MDPLIHELSRRYNTLPKQYKARILGGLLVFIANQSMVFGESVGWTLYYLTH